MPDLDTDLSARLSRLAAAVPIAPGLLDVVHREAVLARQQVRMAWLTPMVVLAAAVLLASTFKLGPFVTGASPAPTRSGAATPSSTGRPDRSPNPMAPSSTPSPENAGLESLGSSDSGDFWLELRSDHRIYRESDTISMVGTLKYLGEKSLDVSGFRPLLFSVREPVYGLQLVSLTTLECRSDRVVPGEMIEMPFVKGGGVSGDDPNRAAQMAYLEDPDFRLPPGPWHVGVRGSTTIGPLCQGASERWSAEIELTVLPDTAERMDLLTGARFDAAECRNRVISGSLAREEGTGLGIRREDGSFQRMLWPYGFTAWDTGNGAILIGEYGQTIAHEGDWIAIEGLDEPGWLVRVGCIDKVVIDLEGP